VYTEEVSLGSFPCTSNGGLRISPKPNWDLLHSKPSPIRINYLGKEEIIRINEETGSSRRRKLRTEINGKFNDVRIANESK
jgi:hypothetical protein